VNDFPGDLPGDLPGDFTRNFPLGMDVCCTTEKDTNNKKTNPDNCFTNQSFIFFVSLKYSFFKIFAAANF
jgi:hypothetical protein